MSDFDVLGTVGKLALPTFARFQISRESELGFVRYGPANRGHRGVFGPFGGTVFRSGFRLDPGKFLAIREFHVVHECVFFPTHARACRSTCCESGRLCAQAWQRRWENSGTFSKTLFRRPVFTRVVDVAPDVGFRRSWYRRKAYATYFPKVPALHRGELGFARYNPANGGRRNVPYAKGFAITPSFLVRFRPVKYGIEALDILYALVKGWYIGLKSGQKWLGQTLGQTWSTLVKLGQLWSNLVKPPQTLGEGKMAAKGLGRVDSWVAAVVVFCDGEQGVDMWGRCGPCGPLDKDRDVNPVKNNETQQRKGTQDRSMEDSNGRPRPFVYDKQEPQYKEDATNGDGVSV
uniref:Uncharacterized protein n=1 Tax=Fagus sylvatica TaxID=28930 RepID=A0A2N9I4J8_FAGSY